MLANVLLNQNYEKRGYTHYEPRKWLAFNLSLKPLSRTAVSYRMEKPSII